MPYSPRTWHLSQMGPPWMVAKWLQAAPMSHHQYYFMVNITSTALLHPHIILTAPSSTGGKGLSAKYPKVTTHWLWLDHVTSPEPIPASRDVVLWLASLKPRSTCGAASPKLCWVGTVPSEKMLEKEAQMWSGQIYPANAVSTSETPGFVLGSRGSKTNSTLTNTHWMRTTQSLISQQSEGDRSV